MTPVINSDMSTFSYLFVCPPSKPVFLFLGPRSQLWLTASCRFVCCPPAHCGQLCVCGRCPMARAADAWKSVKLDTTALPPTASASASSSASVSGLPPSVTPQTPLPQRPHSQSPASATSTHQEEQYVSEEAPNPDNELYKDAETITGTSADFANSIEWALVCCHGTKWLGSDVITVCVI